MTGASRKHNLVSGNIYRELSLQLKKHPCEAYINDMRVKAAEAHSYYYPDIAVACGTPQFEDAQVDTILNPTLLIEVLSPSTEAYDRGGKFAHYRKIATRATICWCRKTSRVLNAMCGKGRFGY